ncbi:hypothetical protein RHGRI_038665 [Rhododendron griersonianum]|uniref:Uncharacterized protein n=1 Tax=Rhododendron griersonianum TaxID=479676 RepID=A0AAV6HMS4_9ERIC|nr:hypothetical protein RHGRI_038665 [Rhododendron griersonianum]
MADGTVSMADGLGLKALDSNELRRRRQLLDPHQKSQIQTLHQGNHNNPILFELDSSHMFTSDESVSRFNNGGTVPIPSSISTPTGSGAPSPNSAKIPNPSQEQQDSEECLGVLSPKHYQSNSARKLHQDSEDSEARMLEIVGHLEDELNNSEDPFMLDVVTAKLQDIQQAWRRAAKNKDPNVASKLLYPPPPPSQWQVVKRGKQKAVEVKNVHPHQSPLPHVLSEASPLVQSKSRDSEDTEDSDDADVELLEVLESVVSSVVSNEAANKDSIVARPGTSTRSDDQQPVGDEKQEKPPDVNHAIPDVKLLLGGSKKASHNGRNRSQSKGSSHKKRK